MSKAKTLQEWYNLRLGKPDYVPLDTLLVRLEDAQQEIQKLKETIEFNNDWIDEKNEQIQKLEFLHKQNYEDSLKLQETVMKLQGCLSQARLHTHTLQSYLANLGEELTEDGEIKRMKVFLLKVMETSEELLGVLEAKEPETETVE